ncbi:MAG TPA: hypothetical protein VIX86_24900 [Streptosporangiaceae bacterium]
MSAEEQAGEQAATGLTPPADGAGPQLVAPPGWLRRLNTGGMLYGTLVAASALAVASGRGDSVRDIVDAMASTVVIYWLAHVYTATISAHQAGPRIRLWRRIHAAAWHEAPILLGGLPPFAVFVGLELAGVGLRADAVAALGTSIATLAVDGFLAGRQAGVRGWRLGTEAGLAAVFGGLIALLMVSLH